MQNIQRMATEKLLQNPIQFFETLSPKALTKAMDDAMKQKPSELFKAFVGEDEKGYNKWQEEKAELQTEANTQKSEYASAISSLISQFQSLQENINSTVIVSRKLHLAFPMSC